MSAVRSDKGQILWTFFSVRQVYRTINSTWKQWLHELVGYTQEERVIFLLSCKIAAFSSLSNWAIYRTWIYLCFWVPLSTLASLSGKPTSGIIIQCTLSFFYKKRTRERMACVLSWLPTALSTDMPTDKESGCTFRVISWQTKQRVMAFEEALLDCASTQVSKRGMLPKAGALFLSVGWLSCRWPLHKMNTVHETKVDIRSAISKEQDRQIKIPVRSLHLPTISWTWDVFAISSLIDFRKALDDKVSNLSAVTNSWSAPPSAPEWSLFAGL